MFIVRLLMSLGDVAAHIQVVVMKENLEFACSHVTCCFDDGAQMSEFRTTSERKQVALLLGSGRQVSRI